MPVPNVPAPPEKALAVATRVLHDQAGRSRRRLDLPGMISLGLGLLGCCGR